MGFCFPIFKYIIPKNFPKVNSKREGEIAAARLTENNAGLRDFLGRGDERDEGNENPIWSLEVAEKNKINKTKNKFPQAHPRTLKYKDTFILLKINAQKNKQAPPQSKKHCKKAHD